MISDERVTELFEKFTAANEANQAVVIEFDRLIKSGNIDMGTASELTRRMNETNKKRMDIWDQLQQFSS